MKIEITIENGWSLKLRQTRQVEASLSSTTSTQPTTNGRYTAHQQAVRRVRSGQIWEESGVKRIRRGRRGTRQQASTNHPPPLIIPPHPPSPLYFSMGGGAVTPQHASPLLAAPAQPETEPRKLSLGFFGPPAPWLVFCERTTLPPPLPRTHHHHTPTQRPLLPFHLAHPKPSHSGSVSEFRPKPAPRLVFRQCTTPPPPLPCTHHHPTLNHRPPSLFHTVRPKLSHSGSVLDFGLKTPPRPHHYLVHTTSPPLPTIPHHRFTWRALNRATAPWFRIFDPNLFPTSYFVNAQPHRHHHLIRPTVPPPFTALHLHFHWSACN